MLMAHDILLENVLKQLHAIDGRAIECLVFNGGRTFWWLCPNFTVIMLHHHHKEGLLFEMNDCNRCPSDNWESSFNATKLLSASVAIRSGMTCGILQHCHFEVEVRKSINYSMAYGVPFV